MFRLPFLIGVRCLPILLFICFSINLHSQPINATETVKNYSNAQKQLLVRSTAKFTHLITQNSLDRDSVMLIACRVTGLPFLTAYADEFEAESSSLGNDLVNAGKLFEAERLLNNLEGNSRMQLLIKLALWHLHRPGTLKSDLDNANHYIQEALTLSSGNLKGKYRYECLNLLGEYYRQSGNEEESRKIYLQMAVSGEQEENKKATAAALHRLGTLHTDIDSLDLIHLDNSLVLYRQLRLKEKEIELLWDIATSHLYDDLKLVKNDLIKILDIQKSIKYSHSLFADYLLAWVYGQQRNYMEVEQTSAAVRNMEWSGMSALEGAFYTKMGVVYNAFEKYDEALSWYKKALEHRSIETNIFWFKGLLYATTMLAVELNRPDEAIALMQEVISECPPVTLWQKAQVLSTKGDFYAMLDNYKLADDNYMSFLKLTNENADIDPFGELSFSYLQIADFYVSRSNLTGARLFLKKVIATRGNAQLRSTLLINHVQFRIDSAAGNYESALKNYILYKAADDSNRNIEQRKAFDELTIKYGTEKKDNDIKLLQKEQQLQGARLIQALGVVALLLVIVGMLAYSTRLKQRTNKKLHTQQREIEGQNLTLRHLVNEKDWLVKEIHHRVKNNLQTVMGLLGTQSGYLRNDEAKNAISDSQRRIQAMSLIHQRLYQSNNLSAIKMTDYIHELVDSLSDSFNVSNNIRFNLEIEPIKLDLAHCIPLGLILNEAITNSFKYALEDSRPGVISISLKNLGENNFLLTIKDNGPGLPPGFDVAMSDSMGMNLMRGLSAEIGAQLILSSQNGVKIEVTFTYDPDIPIDITQSKTEKAYSL